jgi:hypothetical protein
MKQVVCGQEGPPRTILAHLITTRLRRRTLYSRKNELLWGGEALPVVPKSRRCTWTHRVICLQALGLYCKTPLKHWHTGSFLVHQEIPDDGSISSDLTLSKTHKLPTSPSLPLLFSCADSVSTHTSSANPSLSNLHLDGGKDTRTTETSDADLPSSCKTFATICRS